jgi:hypothetical protein
MNTRDPKLVALLFNECITHRNLEGLAGLMTEDHAFIDRVGKVSTPKELMVKGWKDFFVAFPHYKNTFSRIESSGNVVAIVGYAYWSAEQPYDPVLWRARIEEDLVAEWRIYDDTLENRALLRLA